MRILGIDVETTGLDTKEDRIIELGAVVWDVEERVPLEMYSSFVLPPPAKLPLSAEITKITGIKEEWLQSHGRQVGDVLAAVGLLVDSFKVSHVVAHNGENFDKPLICSEIDRAGMASPLKLLPWIDTRMDLPFVEEPISRRLNHLALDHGFINPFKHRALFDVLTMLRVMGHYDFTQIMEQTKIPWVTMRALVSYDERDKAKELRYSWEQIGEKKYPKMWVKRIRENRVGDETATAAAKGFKAVRIE